MGGGGAVMATQVIRERVGWLSTKSKIVAAHNSTKIPNGLEFNLKKIDIFQSLLSDLV